MLGFSQIKTKLMIEVKNTIEKYQFLLDKNCWSMIGKICLPQLPVILTESIAHSKTSEWLSPSMTFFLMIFKVSQVPII